MHPAPLLALMPGWLGRILSVDVPTDATIEALEPGFRGGSLWMLALGFLFLAAVGVGALVLYFTERGTIGPVRRLFATMLRVGIVFVVLFLLAKPAVSLVLKRERPRGVLVLLDNSQSMKLQDRRVTLPDKRRVAIANNLLPLGTSVEEDRNDAEALSKAPKDPSRAELVRAILTHPDIKLTERLQKFGPVRPYLFGTDLRGPGEEAGQGDAGSKLLASFNAADGKTALAEAIVKALQSKEGELPSAIVVITDGQDNASKFTFSPQEVLQEAALECARKGVPLHIYGVGSAEGGGLQFKEVLAPDTMFVDDTIAVPLRWRAQGFKKGKVTVTLKLGGQQVAQKEIDVQNGEDLRDVLSFVVPKGAEKEEDRDLTATIQYKNGETFKDTITKAIRVADRKIKILYIENGPRWEYKFLQPALLRDRRVQADFILLHGDKEMTKAAPFLPEFPRTREQFFDAKYNLIVLGDVPADALGREHMEWIREFVENRGGLIVVAGRQHMPSSYLGTPLEDVLPVKFAKQKRAIDPDVRTQEYLPTLTDVGERSDMLALGDTPEENLEIWQKKLVGFHWQFPIQELRPGAVPLLINPRAKLADGQPMPLMVEQHYGKGQVVFMGSDETWRWRWNYQDKYFVRFWGQMIYQLGLPSLLGDSAKRSQVALERGQATLGAPGSVFVRLLDKDFNPRRDATVDATLDYLDAKRGQEKSRPTKLYAVQGKPGEYRALLTHDMPGRWELKINNPDPTTFSFRVELPPRHELEDSGMAEKSLRSMAELSGGRFYREEDVSTLPEHVQGRTVEYRERLDVLLYPLGLLFFIGLMTLEWLVRKFSNLS